MGTHPIFESDFDCLTGMEKCFAYFGLPNLDGIAGPMGVNDEQVQLQELEDIETTMPDAKIIMIEPSPIDMNSLRKSLSDYDRSTAFDLYTNVEIGENNNDVVEVVYHIVMPAFYPSIEQPDISFTCEELDNKTIQSIHDELVGYMKDSTGNDRIVLDCLDWIETKIAEALRMKPT